MSIGKIPVSVLIPTKNEELNIEECLKSVERADEVLVFDSYSTDRTLDLVQARGVSYYQRVFDNFATHKNWALDHLPFRNAWILIVDADERITDALWDEIAQTIAADPEAGGFYIARKIFVMGRWMRYGGWYPDYNLRLFRHHAARYEKRIVHEHMLVQGMTGRLKEPLIHNDYKGLERYFDRHNTYSSFEAIEAYKAKYAGHRQEEGTLSANLFKGGPERRRFIKHIAYRYLPGRTLFKFLYLYFFKLGFLDGVVGFRFCLLKTFYEYQISLKIKELDSGTHSPLYQKYKHMIEEPMDNPIEDLPEAPTVTLSRQNEGAV